jgi:hypothetical protein
MNQSSISWPELIKSRISVPFFDVCLLLTQDYSEARNLEESILAQTAVHITNQVWP